VVWSRALSALFGSALVATGLLLGLFMAGLGGGSAAGARWAARSRRPLSLFGLAEVGIGLWVLATPSLFRLVAPLVVRLDVLLPDRFALLVPTLFALAILSPVILLMGATFPLFLAHASREIGRPGVAAGRVYGVNTLGAVAGTLAGGLLLLPALGIRGSLVVAGLADVLVGLACLAIGRRSAIGGYSGARETESTAPSSGPRGSEAPGKSAGPARSEGGGGSSAGNLPGASSSEIDLFRLARRTAFLGGFAALALEVAWFRLLMLVFGSSVYALSLMLAAFLLGLAGGSLAAGRRLDSGDDLAERLGRTHLLVAFSSVLATVLLQVVPIFYIALLRGSHGAFAPVAAGSFGLILALLLVPTWLMGKALPTSIRLAGLGGSDRPGRIYAASSLGSSLGALAAGFVAVPLLGVRGTLAVAAAASMGASLLAFARAKERRASLRLGFSATALVALLFAAWFGGLLPWSWKVLTAGYYAYAHLYSGDRVEALGGALRRTVEIADDSPWGKAVQLPPSRPAPPGNEEERLLSWEEGRFAQVAVVESGSIRSLLINGKADASNGPGDMRTQSLLGHLPILLAPDDPAGRALVVGLGSGVTAGAVASWPRDRIVAAEIEPAVARAARFFAAENGGVLDSPRLELRIDDGRRVLDRSGERFSLLTSEPSNLWMSGVSLLFTREFFDLAAERLGERGVLCQWLHLYQVGEEDVKTLVATLLGPFPHAVAFADGTDLLLVASRAPLQLDPAQWRRRIEANPGAARSLAAIGIDRPSAIAGAILADGKGLRAWSKGAALHTDDRPILEFRAARRMASDRSAPILASLVAAGGAAGPIPLGSGGRIVGLPPKGEEK
jgi:spermidine synthase